MISTTTALVHKEQQRRLKTSAEPAEIVQWRKTHPGYNQDYSLPQGGCRIFKAANQMDNIPISRG